MKQEILTVKSNDALTKSVYRMRLEGDLSSFTRPGQFCNIALPGFYLRRPISVCDIEDGVLTLLYKVVGHGTEAMADMKPGTKLDVLCGLGNGYDTEKSGPAPLLLGGGVGIPPLYGLAKALIAEGKQVRAILGFNTAEEIFWADEFRALGADVTVTTADGSAGVKGFVTDAMPDEYSYFYTCGPIPMLRAVYAKTVTSGQFSFEARMGCGFGACMGCSMKTADGGYKRVCREGPVFEKEEIVWES